MKDPVRWIDDPDAPLGLREDLERTRELSEHFGTDAGLARLQTKLVSPLSPLWKLGGIVGLGAIALVLWKLSTRTEPAPIVPTPDPTPAIAVEVPKAEETVPVETLPVVAPPATTSAPKKIAPVAAVDPLDEINQLSKIRALVATDPGAALSGAAEGDRLFSHGQLHQEREIVAIDALDKLGRTTDAQTRARAFMAAHPDTPYAEHLRTLAEKK